MRFDGKRLDTAFSVVRRYVAEGQIPGAVACVGLRDGAETIRSFGCSQTIPLPIEMTDDTLFDVASVTKAVCTATITLVFLESGLLRLDDPITAFIPEFAEKSGQVAIRHLLTHTSGLPAWKPLYLQVRDRDALLAELFSTPLQYQTGSKVEYSCLGYILLGEALTRLSGKSLDTLARHLIFEPLGMADSLFNPGQETGRPIAATEYNQTQGSCLKGMVHDENARSLGGVSGNAGLFTTAPDLAKFCRMMLNMGRHEGQGLLSEKTVRLAISDHTGHIGESRGLGWAIKGTGRYSSAGDLFSASSFGHTGFTGTSVWIDPEAGLYAILLTNSIHPTRENKAHIRLRPLFHNAVAAAVAR